jgi:hypothetical protein
MGFQQHAAEQPLVGIRTSAKGTRLGPLPVAHGEIGLVDIRGINHWHLDFAAVARSDNAAPQRAMIRDQRLESLSHTGSMSFPDRPKPDARDGLANGIPAVK